MFSKTYTIINDTAAYKYQLVISNKCFIFWYGIIQMFCVLNICIQVEVSGFTIVNPFSLFILQEMYIIINLDIFVLLELLQCTSFVCPFSKSLVSLYVVRL
jgi:hypothetical protein